MLKTALGAAALGAASLCMGTESGIVGINISLATGNSPAPGTGGVCVSQTLSERNGAVVRVVCESGQFVSISPIPGGRFVGTHGGAYSYHFGSTLRGVNVAGYGEFANGAGSIASFRVFDLSESGGRLDMLVSF